MKNSEKKEREKRNSSIRANTFLLSFMHQFTATSTCSAYFRWIRNFEAHCCWAAIFREAPRPADLKSRTKIFRKAIAMCGSARRILRSRLFLQFYNTRRHWRVSVSGLESSAVREGRGGEEKKKRNGRRRRKRWRHIHSCPRGTRGRPLLECIVNCSGIQDTLRSWAGDARARVKQVNSSFESPTAVVSIIV